MLLLLNRFSRVRLCATPETEAHQAPPSLGFSRQEHWSGLPFPFPMQESEVIQSGWTFSDPMDRSPPGSSIHEIFQARVLEWVGIAFSDLTLCISLKNVRIYRVSRLLWRWSGLWYVGLFISISTRSTMIISVSQMAQYYAIYLVCE